MIVDDSDDIATGLKAGLEQLGYEVVIAHNGPLALRLSRDFIPDVAVLDLGLPVMDGWELARRLRELHPELRFIAVTGFSDDDARARSADAGFVDHLIKPIGIDVIDSAVKNLGAR